MPFGHFPIDGAVFVLGADEEALERPQQGDRKADHHHRPDDKVNPDRRILREIEPDRADCRNRPDDERHEDRRPIGRIVMGKIQIAHAAPAGDLQKATKKPALPASGAAAGNRF